LTISSISDFCETSVWDCHGGGADLARDPLGALHVEVGDDDLRTLLGKALCHALTEAGCGAGDDCDLVFQTSH
jgi:hypothetical protein